MGQLKSILQATQSSGEITGTVNGAAISLNGAQSVSVQLNVTVDTPSPAVFASAAVNTSTSVVTLASHGLTTGDKGQMTTSGGLPSGLATSTNYFIIVLTASTFQFASSLANALAGTFISLTTQGTGNQTFTPTALAGASYTAQKSNDGVNFITDGSAISISSTASFWYEMTAPTAQYLRFQYTLTAGQFNSVNYINVKGLA